jgi:hypothetical protein
MTTIVEEKTSKTNENNAPEKKTNDEKKEVKNFAYQKKPGLYVFVGKPESGKSVALKQILYQHLKDGYFKFGIAICQTKFNEGYNFLDSNLVWPKYDEDKLKAYVEKMEEWMIKNKQKKPPANFVVLDDCLGDIKQNSPFFKNWIACYRHYNTSVFITAQYLASGLSTQIRDATTMAFIFSTRFGHSKDILWTAYGSSLKRDEFVEMLDNATDEKYYCLVFVNDKQKHNTFHCFKSEVAPNFKVSFDNKKKKPKPGLETRMALFQQVSR